MVDVEEPSAVRVVGLAETVVVAVDAAAGETATVSRSAPVVVSPPAVAVSIEVPAAYNLADAPAVETPFVNVIVVAVPNVRAAPVLSVVVGSKAPSEAA